MSEKEPGKSALGTRLSGNVLHRGKLSESVNVRLESGRAVLITFSCTSWPSNGLGKPQRWEGRKGIQRILLTQIEDNHKQVQDKTIRPGVHERPISANPGLKFVPLFVFTFQCNA